MHHAQSDTAWRIANKGDRYAIVSPTNGPLFLLGINHLNTAPEGRANPEYFMEAIVRIRELGYINSGYGTPEEIQSRFPFIEATQFTSNGHAQPKEKFGYEDIFDSKIQDEIRARVQEMVSRSNDNPNLIGYYWTDTPRWDISLSRQRRGDDWVSAMRALPADAPGKRAYAEFIKHRYQNDPKRYSAVYGHTIASFEDIRLNEFWEFDRSHSVGREDDEAFIGVIAGELYRVIGEAFREHAPGKLLLGERYKLHDHPDAVLKEAAKWVDAISIQPGPEVGPLPGPGRDESEFDPELFDHIYEVTGKPILICDHQVSFYTDDHPSTLWHQLPDVDEALAVAEAWVRAALEKPYIIGYQRCQYADVFNPHRGNMLKQGILRLDSTPYPKMEAGLKAMNDAIVSEWRTKWQI